MEETNILIACGLFGVLAHCLLKAQSLQIDAKKANLPFSFGDYVKNDYIGISLSIVCVFLWLFLFPEAAVKYPALANWVRGSFIAMGMVGSYLIQLLLSQAKRKIRKVVDTKTDKADGV